MLDNRYVDPEKRPKWDWPEIAIIVVVFGGFMVADFGVVLWEMWRERGR